MLGKHHSEETKQRMSEAQKGKKNHNYGKNFSEETKLKISKAQMGNKNLLGKYPTKETRQKISKANNREKNGHWKGGFIRDDEGYIQFRVPKRCQFFSMKGKNGYIRLHRLMMAEFLQKPLRPEEVVHHKNGDITDNRIENLELFKNNGKHTSLHRKLKNNKKGGNSSGNQN